ncbi:MAG: hypothetical protein AAGK05_15125, partial [Pseudomonadota bacterium]
MLTSKPKHHSNSHNFSANPKNKSSHDQTNKKCYRCGSNSHLASDSRCPAKNATCNFCKKTGHFSSVCSSKKNSSSNNSSSSQNSQNRNSVNMNILQTDSNVATANKPYATIELSTNRGTL